MTAGTPPPSPAAEHPSAALRVTRIASAAVAAVLATISAVFGVLAYVLVPHADPAALEQRASTAVISEPYLLTSQVKAAYRGQTPRAVELDVEEFNTDARTDLKEATQDFQTRYAPAPICADLRSAVVAVYGPRGCSETSPFYTTSRKYERGLIVWSARGDPVDSHPIKLSPVQIRRAFTRMRAAETSMTACRITNNGKYAVNVDVSPDPGFVVVDGQSKFTLDPKDSRAVLLRPGEELDTALGSQPSCSLDRTIANKELGKPYPRWAIICAVVFAALAGLSAALMARRKPLG